MLMMRPAALRLHDSESRPGAEERRPQVGGDNVIPVFGGYLINWGRMKNTGIINEDIESAEARHRLFKEVIYLRLDFNIGGDYFNVPTQSFNRL